VRDAQNPTTKYYAPDSSQADDYGFVNAPNVDVAKQLVDQQIASYDYKANLKAIKIASGMEQNLLDMLG
jgi:flagellar basal body rod protein FlgC